MLRLTTSARSWSRGLTSARHVCTHWECIIWLHFYLLWFPTHPIWIQNQALRWCEWTSWHHRYFIIWIRILGGIDFGFAILFTTPSCINIMSVTHALTLYSHNDTKNIDGVEKNATYLMMIAEQDWGFVFPMLAIVASLGCWTWWCLLFVYLKM